MSHAVVLTIAVLAALGVTLILATWGAHGVQGSLAIYMGYPGGFANWKLNPGRVSYILITAVNGLAYFACLELLLAMKRRISN